MLVELHEKEVEIICEALYKRAAQLRLEYAVSSEDDTIVLADRMTEIAKEINTQSKKYMVRNFFPGT